jgi:N-acetylglucosamine-6-phosphate deacetylase
LGARQATHTFNAMTGVHHRLPGAAGAALTLDAIKAEAITDMIHVHAAILNLIVRAKGPHGVIAITDAMRGAGMGEGQFDLGGQAVFVRGERATLADGTLAGSILTMDAGFRNLAAATGLPPAALAPIFSGNAAAQLGLSRKGHIAPHMDADLTILDAALHVWGTVVSGQVVYRRG